MDRKKKSYNLLIGIAALVAIVAAVALVGYIVSEPDPIVLQGQAEAAEYRVSGKVPGRVEKFYAGEGDFVHKGDTLVKIESPEVQAKMAQAMAVKSAAEAQKDKALKGARQEQIAAAYEMWQKALAGEEVMKKSFERTARLYEQEVVSAQKFDEVQAQYKAAKATSAAAKSQYDMAVRGARIEDIETAIMSDSSCGRYCLRPIPQTGRTGRTGGSHHGRHGSGRCMVYIQYQGRYAQRSSDRG